mmetsp:Transcript_19510/g.61291  ORF Transcript_19510/g.61291 Transcript_19510/m.61291 type:complete len:114 (+) Transcript_19510:52-393(+)
MQIYQKVNRGIGKVSFSGKVKPAQDLIRGLCTANPSERLPMKKEGIRLIQRHPWFAGFDWDAMEKLTMKPPYVPVVKNKRDAGNFKAKKEDMPPMIQYKDDKSGWDKDFATSK